MTFNFVQKYEQNEFWKYKYTNECFIAQEDSYLLNSYIFSKLLYFKIKGIYFCSLLSTYEMVQHISTTILNSTYGKVQQIFSRWPHWEIKLSKWKHAFVQSLASTSLYIYLYSSTYIQCCVTHHLTTWISR